MSELDQIEIRGERDEDGLERVYLVNDQWPETVQIVRNVWPYVDDRWLYRVGRFAYFDLQNGCAEYELTGEDDWFWRDTWVLRQGWLG